MNFLGIKIFFSVQKERTILKRMNIIADQQGIINRYLREKGGWDEHLTNTKNFILSATQNSLKNTLAILGSGWLLDIPLDELSKLYKQVILIDICHPTQIRYKIKKYSNVILETKDITGGGIKHAYNIVKTFKKNKTKTPVDSFKNYFYSLKQSYDFVVSANILNQLDILIIDYLKQFNIYSNKEILEIRKIIQQQHIKVLPKAKSCLIADVEEKLYDKNNNFLKSNPTVHINLPKSNYSAIWDWKFDTTMSYYPKKKTYFKVIALGL